LNEEFQFTGSEKRTPFSFREQSSFITRKYFRDLPQ